MRIGIDCRLAGIKHAGIGRYIENLIHNLIDLSNNVAGLEWILFFYDEVQAQTVLQKKSEIKNIKVIIAPIKHYSLAEQLKFPKILKSEKLDLLHIPHFNAPVFYTGKIVCTIHDLLWHEQKGLSVTTLNRWHYWLKYLGYKLTTFFTIVKSKIIFVPSQTIKDIVVNHYPFAKQKILVTYEGIADIFRDYKQNVSNSKKIIYTGSLYPHKNIKIVLEALVTLPDYELIVVGSRNVFQEQTLKLAKKFKVDKQVKFLGYVSDKKLVELYHQSKFLIQPSLSEGFGLTGVEAMATGLPVVASKIKIFSEIYEEGAIYFNPHYVNELLSAIKSMNNKDKVLDLKQKGANISKKYSWKKMASQVWEAYDKILNEK